MKKIEVSVLSGGIVCGLAALGLATAAFAQAAPTPLLVSAAPSIDSLSSTPASSPSEVTLVSPGQAPPSQIQALARGDNQTVTMVPVPDTQANRARFGEPMSNAGKKTAPAGN